jgi:S1-C subfamily serine protease
MVMHVPENGPAFRAGIQPQAVITAINGTPLDYPDDIGVLDLFRTFRPGEKVRLTLASPEAKEVVVVASEMPPDMVAAWKRNFEPAAPKRP